MIRANVREPDQVVGDFYSLAACNEVGHRRLLAMLDEFGLADLDALADFIFDATRQATLRAHRARCRTGPGATRCGSDGYDAPVQLRGARSISRASGSSATSPGRAAMSAEGHQRAG